MELTEIKAVYFIGAGGIGMSAIARYFIHKGMVVAGYDKTATALTQQLCNEGMSIHYEDDVKMIPESCKDKSSTLVIYTPAIPHDHSELLYFQQEGFEIQKRAQVLGTLTRTHKGLCVAGTHGKTSTSTICAHIMHQSKVDCNAFLGGISKNYGTNYILSGSDYVVIEADEYDRSFHQLRPWISVITATDPDHLDIYGTEKAYIESFEHYTELIQAQGALILHTDVKLQPRLKPDVKLYRYGLSSGDFHAKDINISNGHINFTFVSPIETITNIELGHPIPINIENAVAAMAMAQLCGCTATELRNAIASYRGVVRRFDYRINTPQIVLLSDYAHHPEEIRCSIESLRQLYAGRKLTVVFQPHLYSRTKDFYQGFANALSLADEVVLTEIYPARELPIEGVTSKLIYDALQPQVTKTLINRKEVGKWLNHHDSDVVAVLGAGDIDDEMPQLTKILQKKYAID